MGGDIYALGSLPPSVWKSTTPICPDIAENYFYGKRGGIRVWCSPEYHARRSFGCPGCGMPKSAWAALVWDGVPWDGKSSKVLRAEAAETRKLERKLEREKVRLEKAKAKADAPRPRKRKMPADGAAAGQRCVFTTS